MSKETPFLYISIADFKDPTLLVLGDAKSLNWLADQIEARLLLDFAAMDVSIRQVKVKLRMIPTTEDGSLNRHDNTNTFDWLISLTESRQFAEQLRALAASETLAHTYLDTASNNSGIEVVVSKGEYDPVAVFRP